MSTEKTIVILCADQDCKFSKLIIASECDLDWCPFCGCELDSMDPKRFEEFRTGGLDSDI